MTRVVTNLRQENAGYVMQSSGPVLYGEGPPRDSAGHIGNVYVDTLLNQLYQKRDDEGIGQWGPYLMTVPVQYIEFIRWYRDDVPPSDFGTDGDFAIVWADDAYGMAPALYGPRAAGSWPVVSNPGFVVNVNASVANYEPPA